MEFSLLAAAALGAGTLYTMLWWEARHGNADRCSGNLWEAALVSVIVGVFVGRLVAMALDGVNPITHPGDVVIVRAGISTVGATAAAAATFLWLARREPVAMADGISAAALAGLAGWHAGCLFRDACLGTPTSLPWAIAQQGSAVGRHPVELYAALLFAIAALALAVWKAYGRPPAGVPAASALLVAGGVRLITEPVRPSLGGGPVWWYALAIAAGAGGVAYFWISSRRAKRRPDM